MYYFLKVYLQKSRAAAERYDAFLLFPVVSNQTAPRRSCMPSTLSISNYTSYPFIDCHKYMLGGKGDRGLSSREKSIPPNGKILSKKIRSDSCLIQLGLGQDCCYMAKLTKLWCNLCCIRIFFDPLTIISDTRDDQA